MAAAVSLFNPFTCVRRFFHALHLAIKSVWPFGNESYAVYRCERLGNGCRTLLMSWKNTGGALPRSSIIRSTASRPRSLIISGRESYKPPGFANLAFFPESLKPISRASNKAAEMLTSAR